MDRDAQIEMLQQLVSSQRTNIEALEAQNARLQRQVERAKAAVTHEKDEPKKHSVPVQKKRSAPEPDETNKKPAKPRCCKVCGEQIHGFGCLKVDCKAELARRKEAKKAAQHK